MISILILSCSSQRMKQDLTVLDLSNKNLKEIPRKALENSARIESLILSNNEFTKFPNSVFAFENLKTLGLKNNDITDIPNEISKLKNLKTLDIRGTKIHELPDSMKDLENLRLVIMFEVDLTDNEKNKIKCVLPSNCEIMFSKKYREYPPYKCD